MKKPVLLAMLFIVLGIASNAQTTISGVTLSPRIAPSNKPLLLNGGGVRTKFFMKVYVAGLYLSAKSVDAIKIIEADEQMSVRMHMISNLMTSENMTRAIREGYDASTGNKSEQFQKEIDLVCSIFQSEAVKIGDMYELFYVPGEGMSAFKNGKKIDVLMKGLAFKQATFGIWLSGNPVDIDLKEGMLGM